jgi:hypothetical protein
MYLGGGGGGLKSGKSKIKAARSTETSVKCMDYTVPHPRKHECLVSIVGTLHFTL